MVTTLNKIREQSPCRDGWARLLLHLKKTRPDDEPLHLRTILEINGLDDTLWCFPAVDGYQREMRLFGVWCARQVQSQMDDIRSVNALDAVERFANGLMTDEELAAAWTAAWEAERVAASYTARLAARAAARLAARAAVGAAVRVAALEAAGDAARRKSQADELRRVLACIDAGVDPYPSQESCHGYDT